MYNNNLFRGICKLWQILENTVTLQKNKNKTCTFFSKCEKRVIGPGPGPYSIGSVVSDADLGKKNYQKR